MDSKKSENNSLKKTPEKEKLPKKPPVQQSETLDRNMDDKTRNRAHDMDYDQPIYRGKVPKKGDRA